MIPYWRYIKYTDDGCDLCQCLNCYNKFESQTEISSWTYCPYCGIKWKGKLDCRDHDTPRWLFEAIKKDNKWKNFSLNSKPIKRGWIIEHQSIDGKWHISCTTSRYKQSSLRQAVYTLKCLRELNKDIKYRARITGLNLYNFGNLYPLPSLEKNLTELWKHQVEFVVPLQVS